MQSDMPKIELGASDLPPENTSQLTLTQPPFVLKVQRRAKSSTFEKKKRVSVKKECEQCKIWLYDAAALSKHNAMIHGIGKILDCDNCDKKFATNRDLQRHQNKCKAEVCLIGMLYVSILGPSLPNLLRLV